jgi:hypothetical protein
MVTPQRQIQTSRTVRPDVALLFVTMDVYARPTVAPIANRMTSVQAFNQELSVMGAFAAQELVIVKPQKPLAWKGKNAVKTQTKVHHALQKEP